MTSNYGFVTISKEELLMMEHDFIVARRKRTEKIVDSGMHDELVAASDLMIYIEAITSFVDELLGEPDDGETKDV